MHMIQVIPYNLQWPCIFETERALIHQAIHRNTLNIHHIGSTAIPGLAAKPIIDIIVSCHDDEHYAEKLASIGYEARGQCNIPFCFYFRKFTSNKQKIHLHFYEHDDDPEIELNLLFRDFLRTHPHIREEYARLKNMLIQQESSHIKKDSLFTGYTLGKNDFIHTVLHKAGFQRLRMLKATHEKEWNAIKLFRSQMNTSAISSLHMETDDHKDHVHFIFYEGIHIIGYAHIQILSHQKAVMWMMVFDQKGSEIHFLNLCERWLKQQKIMSLHVNISPETSAFYRSQDYVPQIFKLNHEDFSGEEHIFVTKILQ